jgi:hypothetical protein
MPDTFYLTEGGRKGERFCRCRYCGWQLPEAFYDKVTLHEEKPVSGKDFHDVVLVQAAGECERYVVLVNNGANRMHEKTYDVSVIGSQVSSCSNDFLEKICTLSSSEIEKEIGESRLRQASAEELKKLNEMVFKYDTFHIHSDRIGANAFRTLSC